ncbi:MAG: DUF4870 domain-containing protein [Bacteroidia bacterium]|nr:DUF4870 domain-containing protein [Bacteroidia bacterium]MBT8278210.1 DUF4870 domain-containing protein [Bacteroidia bacterium]NND26412.1 DUF4870 domain-containing protein [Flavobacteriaceae bacterium]NNK59006.1 DUF4870 domain-containing protein [Flavobacteriaceae bacterium]NNL32574.1 DUF4870 domain-containing protein [Flavobacteriaceae bacterium]
MLTNNQKNIATIIHLSTFAQYFFPFGNFILPIVLWTLNKDKSDFVDTHGKQAINFQLSLLIYGIGISIIAVPLFILTFIDRFPTEHIFNHRHIYIDSPNWADASGMIIFAILAGIIALAIFVLNVVLVITAASKANNKEIYKYPLTIQFLK